MATLAEFIKIEFVKDYRGFVKIEKEWYEFDVAHVFEKFPEVDLESFDPVILKRDEIHKFNDRTISIDNFESQLKIDKDFTDIPPPPKTLQDHIADGTIKQLPDSYIASNMAVWTADSFCQQKAKVLQMCVTSRQDLMKIITRGQKEIDYLKSLVKKYPAPPSTL